MSHTPKIFTAFLLNQLDHLYHLDLYLYNKVLLS